MNARSLLLAAAAAALAAPVSAQTGTALAPVADVRTLWAQTRDYLVEAAKDVPESMYSVPASRPTFAPSAS